MIHFSDRLAAAIRARRSVVCVGLDPALERMPPSSRRQVRRPRAPSSATTRLWPRAFRSSAPGSSTPSPTKPPASSRRRRSSSSTAPPGWRALDAVIHCAHRYELPVILDVKRGDIASTGAAYARAAFGGAPGFAAPVDRRSPPTP